MFSSSIYHMTVDEPADIVISATGVQSTLKVGTFRDLCCYCDPGRIHIDDVGCGGLESSLHDCPYRHGGSIELYCDHSLDVAVRCLSKLVLLPTSIG